MTLQLCLKQSRLFAGLALVQNNWRVRDRLGFQGCRDCQLRKGPSHPAHVSYKEGQAQSASVAAWAHA